MGNNGKTVFFSELPEATTNSNIAEIARELLNGQIDNLIILGGNPALTAPADLNWAAAQKKAKAVIRLGYYEDETFGASPETTLSLPATHFLESWGDARTSDGSLVPVQPLIAPLFDGITELEVLSLLGGLGASKGHDIVRETFRAYLCNTTSSSIYKKNALQMQEEYYFALYNDIIEIY